jgi:hypothetical protein
MVRGVKRTANGRCCSDDGLPGTLGELAQAALSTRTSRTRWGAARREMKRRGRAQRKRMVRGVKRSEGKGVVDREKVRRSGAQTRSPAR